MMIWDVPNRERKYKPTYYCLLCCGWFIAIVGLMEYLIGNMMMDDATTEIEELKAVGQGLLGMIWMIAGWGMIGFIVQRRYFLKHLDRMGEAINHNARELEVIQAQSRGKE